MRIEEIISKIQPLNQGAMQESQKRWNKIAKPLHSLGRLEDDIAKIAGITGSSEVGLDKKALVIFCADNGVVEEGITQTGQEVTAIVAENFLKGKATASIMAGKLGVDVFPIDIGMVADTKVPSKKTLYGTKNFLKGEALSRENVCHAMKVGMELAETCKQKGYHMIAMGEMGIGNTTTSSAVASVLTGYPVEQMTGKGAGLSDQGLMRKIQVIQQGIALHNPKASDVIGVLSKVGGLDLAGLAGLCLGGALSRIPILIDGFISGVAALAAVRLEPKVSDYLLASHVSGEPAGALVLEELGLQPLLTCEMCLGEGTGALLAMPLLETALEVYHKMSTFEEIEVEEYQPFI